MHDSERRDVSLTPEVLDLVTRAQQDRERQSREKAEEETKKERKTKRRPHETKRRARQMSVTFPAAGWKQALQDRADEWGLRPSDLLTYCVAHTMAAIERGELKPPKGKGKDSHFRHRAGEFLDLPWEPSENG